MESHGSSYYSSHATSQSSVARHSRIYAQSRGRPRGSDASATDEDPTSTGVLPTIDECTPTIYDAPRTPTLYERPRTRTVEKPPWHAGIDKLIVDLTEGVESCKETYEYEQQVSKSTYRAMITTPEGYQSTGWQGAAMAAQERVAAASAALKDAEERLRRTKQWNDYFWDKPWKRAGCTDELLDSLRGGPDETADWVSDDGADDTLYSAF